MIYSRKEAKRKAAELYKSMVAGYSFLREKLDATPELALADSAFEELLKQGSPLFEKWRAGEPTE